MENSTSSNSNRFFDQQRLKLTGPDIAVELVKIVDTEECDQWALHGSGPEINGKAGTACLRTMSTSEIVQWAIEHGVGYRIIKYPVVRR